MPRTAGGDPRMVYTDEDGAKLQFYESGIRRLKFIAAHKDKPVGRLQTPTPWKVHEVRQYEDQGLWEVKWLERGDTERKHAWEIIDLTAKGRNIIRAWDERAAAKSTKKEDTA